MDKDTKHIKDQITGTEGYRDVCKFLKLHLVGVNIIFAYMHPQYVCSSD